MIRKLAVSSALLLALAGSAIAQSAAPANTETAPAASAPAASAPAPAASAPAADLASADDCLKSAFDLATRAEEKKLTNEDLDKLEELLTRMEGHCDANELREASLIGGDIKTMIDAK